MQGLREMWDLDRLDYTWAVAGYQGAIRSGYTTCGLLMGCTIAIGMRYGQGKKCIPIDDKETREKAIQDVNKLYQEFIEQFGDTTCRELVNCDFSKHEDQIRFMEEEIYKDKCLVFFKFIMNRFIGRDKLESK